MFDRSSRALLRDAPALPGLDPNTLDELLTAAHVELATARLQIVDGGSAAAKVLDRVRRLASTFEAYVALNIRPEQTRAAAFVAGSAYQILSRARTSRADGPTLVTCDAIGSTISSVLLFLIADRAADAAEAAVGLKARGEVRAVRRSLILNIREFAAGKLSLLVERNLDEDRLLKGDSREEAADLLFRECSRVIQVLAREALGRVDADLDVHECLARVIELSQTSTVELPFGFEGVVHQQFGGPHHLATLLKRLVDGVRAAMLIRLPAPSGAKGDAWNDWIQSQVAVRPFLWINHVKAIQTRYLDRGRSMVMTSPTGSGKTTLSVLKIASTLCAGESIVYLAPTHALVDQIEPDLSGQVGDIKPVSVEDTALEELGERLPPFSVMTPERCLALLGFAPELFSKVGLLVFDEFHLVSAGDPLVTPSVNGRAIDSMLALLTFVGCQKKADLLLLSAMVANGNEIACWLKQITGRDVEAFDDPWKPTRQLRSCVIYDEKKVIAAAQAAAKLPTKKARNLIPAQPLGLFSLISGWHPRHREKLVIRALTERLPPLKLNEWSKPTSNRNEVAAQIAAECVAIGKRVIVFCNDSKSCKSVADEINRLFGAASQPLTEVQDAIRKSVLKDVGSSEAAFDPTGRRAAVHHGDLLPLERKLTESIFRERRDPESELSGLDMIAATSTIAQGLNLPCDVVILAGTDRSTVDDSSDGPRTDLRPHEILNALGRAGRAAYAATGLAFVVPGKPIIVDLDKPDFETEVVLETVFSEQDACEAIFDPIEIVLDRIEAAASADPKVQSMIRRLSAVATSGESGFDDIVRRSFGYFRKKAADANDAEKWLKRRRDALAAAEVGLKDPPVVDWQRDIAVRNGISPGLIARLVDALKTAPMDESSTAAWFCWLLDVIAQYPLDLTVFVREGTLSTVFGRAYSNSRKPDETARLILNALKVLVSMWCGGRSLVDIEKWLFDFVLKNEGTVKMPARSSHTAQRARRFAIRIIPDLGFLGGILGQVATRIAAEENRELHPVIDMLPQMVRAGDHDRHHSILRQMTSNASRVETYEACEKMRSMFTAGPDADIEAVRQEVRIATLLTDLSAPEDGSATLNEG